MTALQGNDYARMVCRLGCFRLGTTRLGVAPGPSKTLPTNIANPSRNLKWTDDTPKPATSYTIDKT